MAVVDELVTILGVDIAKDAMAKLKTFSSAVEGAAKKMKIAGAVVTGAATGFGAFLRVVINDAAELDKLSKATGLSAEALQEWDYAAKSSNLDAKALRSDIEKLTKTMSSPIPGQFNQNLAMMGISVRDASGSLKTADNLLLDMADKFKSMSQQRAMQWADKIGVSRDTMLLLRQGKVGIEELRKEAHKLGGIIPDESIKRAAEFKKQVSELTFALRGIAAQAAIATIPALTKIVSAFKDFIAANREWIQLGLESLMGGIVAGFDRFWKAIKKVGDFFKPLKDTIKSFLPEMSGMEWVTHLVTGALTGLLIVFAPLLAKLALIGAAIAGVALLFEDFFVFLNGGESVIGDLFKAFEERWPSLYAALGKVGRFIKEHFVDALMAVWNVIKGVGKGLWEVFSHTLDILDELIGPVIEFFSTFEEKFPGLYEIIVKIADVIGKTLAGAFKIAIAVVKDLLSIVGEVLKALGWIVDKGLKALEWGAKKLGFGGGEDDTDKTGGTEKGTEPTLGNLQRNLALESLSNIAMSFLDARMAGDKAAAVGATAGNQTQITDNSTKNYTVISSDPAKAGESVREADKNDTFNTNTPGSYVPVAG